MNLLKKWRKHNPGEEHAIVKRRDDRHGLVRFRDLRERMEDAFERVWRQMDRDPWSAVSRLPEELSATWNWPAVDVAEDDKALTLRVDVPGMDSKDLDVEVSGNLLTIRGSREDEWASKKHGVRRRERVSGRFARTITLPSYVDPQQIDARYGKGTLTLVVPKIPGKGPKRVQVTAA